MAVTSLTTPGKDTSENESTKTAKVWIRFACSVVAAICTALLATKVIPPESAWIGILGIVAAVATMVGGEVASTKNYTASRTEVKVAEMDAIARRAIAAATASAAAMEGAKKNPPPPASSGLD